MAIFLFAGFVTTVFLVTYSSRVRLQFIRLVRVAVLEETGLDVRVRDIAFDLFPPQVSVKGVNVRKLGQAPFLTVDQIKIVPGITRSLGGRLAVDWLEVRSPALHLTWTGNGFEELVWRKKDTTRTPADLPFELWGAFLKDAKVVVDVPGRARVSVQGLYAFAAPQATGAIPVQIVLPPVTVELPNKTIVLRDIQAGLRVDKGNLLSPKEIFVQSLQFISDAGSFETAGDVDVARRSTDARVHFNVDLDVVKALFPKLPALGGRVAVSAKVHAAPDDPALDLEVDGVELAYAGIMAGNLHLETKLTNQLIDIKNLTLRTAGGEAQVSGRVTPTGNFPAELAVTWNGLELAEILDTLGLKDPWVVLRSNGQAKLSGHLVSKGVNDNLLSGPVHIDVLSFTSRDRSFRLGQYQTILQLGRAKIDGTFRLFRERIELEGAHIKGDPGQLDLEARFYFDQALGFRIKGESDAFDLKKFGKIANVTLGGAGSLHFDLGGPYGPPDIDADVSFDDMEIEGIPLGHLDSKVAFHDHHTLEFPDATATLGTTVAAASGALDFAAGPSLRVTGKINHGDAADLQPLLATLPEALRTSLNGDVSGDFKISGLAAALDLTSDFYSEGFEALGQPFSRAVGRLRMQRGLFAGLDMTLNVDDGKATLKLEGRRDQVSFETEIDKVPVSALRFLAGARQSVRGTLSARAAGKFATPNVAEGRFEVQGLSVAGRPAGTLGGTVRLIGDEVKLEAEGLEKKLAIHGEADIGARPIFELKMVLNQTAIGALLGFGESFEVVASGSGELAGSFSSLDSLSGRIDLQGLSIQGAEVGAVAKSRVHFELKNRKITFEDVGLIGKGIDIATYGYIMLDGHLNVHVAGDLDALAIAPFVPGVELFQGRLPFDITLGGTLDDLAPRGKASFDDLRLKFSFLEEPLEHLSGKIDVFNNRVSFDELTADLGGGEVDASGEIVLDHLNYAGMSFKLALDDVAYLVPGDIPARLSGTVRIETNAAKQFEITGDVKLGEVRYTKDLAVGSLILSFGRRAPKTRVLERASEIVNFDVDLKADGGIVVDNNLAKAEFKANNLKLTGTNQRVGLTGTITPIRAQLFFRNIVFDVTSGNIEFTDPYQILPRFDMNLKTFACGADIYVSLRGTVDEIAKFQNQEVRGRDSRGPLPYEDVITCLGAGFRQSDSGRTVLSPQDSTGTQNNITQAFDVLATVTGIDQKIRQLVPDLQVRLGTSYSQRSRRAVPIFIAEKDFGGKLKLRFTSSLLSEDQKVELQTPLPFAGNVNFNLGWTNGNDPFITNDLGADLRSHWDF